MIKPAFHFISEPCLTMTIAHFKITVQTKCVGVNQLKLDF